LDDLYHAVSLVATRKPHWLVRLDDIIDRLSELPAPVVDRRSVETVFQLKRRHAIELMHQLGSYRQGNRFVLDREVLIRDLNNLRYSAQFQWEQRRKQRRSEELDLLRKHISLDRLSFVGLRSEAGFGSIPLPDGIRLEPGQITISFNRPEDLRNHLFALAQALVHDSDAFGGSFGGVERLNY
jgi:hypothetical protein